eukprot:1190757-Pleurochrysis_carterae.AAC.1
MCMGVAAGVLYACVRHDAWLCAACKRAAAACKRAALAAWYKRAAHTVVWQAASRAMQACHGRHARMRRARVRGMYHASVPYVQRACVPHACDTI